METTTHTARGIDWTRYLFTEEIVVDVNPAATVAHVIHPKRGTVGTVVLSDAAVPVAIVRPLGTSLGYSADALRQFAALCN